MDKFIEKAHLGEFFAKMYETNEGKNIEVSLRLNENKIEVYNKANVHFEYIYIIESMPTVESIIQAVTEE